MPFDLTTLPESGMFDPATGEHASGKPVVRFALAEVYLGSDHASVLGRYSYHVIAYRPCPTEYLKGLCVLETIENVYVVSRIVFMG